VVLPVTLQFLNLVEVHSQGRNRTWRLRSRALVVPWPCLMVPSPCVFAEEDARQCLARLFSLLPLLCPPSAALPLGCLCQGPLPRFIFACWKVCLCPQDDGKVLRSAAQRLVNSFCLSLLLTRDFGGCRPTIRTKLQIGWGFAAFVAPVPRWCCAGTNPGFWKTFRLWI